MNGLAVVFSLVLILLVSQAPSLAQEEAATQEAAKPAEGPLLIYVRMPEENLRIAPAGDKIGSISRQTAMEKIGEVDNWVQVQVVGWVWKASTTEDLREITPETVPLAVSLTSGTFLDGGSKFKITGEIRNVSDQDYSFVRIVAKLFDETTLVAEQESFTTRSFVGSAQTDSFEVEFSPPPRFDGYLVEVHSYRRIRNLNIQQ